MFREMNALERTREVIYRQIGEKGTDYFTEDGVIPTIHTRIENAFLADKCEKDRRNLQDTEARGTQ